MTTVRPIPEKEPLAKGARTRESILRVAVDLASLEGLEGISIGRLADELKMSKSGLFAHFGSKEELQLATVSAAREIFAEHVVRPAVAEPAGAPRLWALCLLWIKYVEGKVFKGGCFFAAASFEFDSRKGPVRDAIANAMQEWLNILTRAVEGAKKTGHLKANVNSEQFAFEIYSLSIGAHWGFQLLEDDQALDRVRTMMRDRIKALATTKCPPLKLPRSRIAPFSPC
jgi:AcrR family transcriptional regulator